MKYQPRYEAYLKTTNLPKNWEFMDFICKMKKSYGKSINANLDVYGSFTIVNQDEFTNFIQREVANGY